MANKLINKEPKYGLRKLSVGAASVMLGVLCYSGIVSADTTTDGSNAQVTVVENTSARNGVNYTDQTALTVTNSDDNSTLASTNEGQTDTQYKLSLRGSFEVPIDDLVNRQTVRLADISTTSSTSKYMNFSQNSKVLAVDYRNVQIGNLQWNYDQNSGKGSIDLVSDLDSSPFTDLDNSAKISISLAQLPQLVTYNWETNLHNFVPVTNDSPFVETLKFTDGIGKILGSYTFKLKPASYPIQNTPLWTSLTNNSGSANDGYFSDYLSPIDNSSTAIGQLNGSRGQAGNVEIKDNYQFFYRLKPKGNSIIDSNMLSMYINKVPNAVTSDGKMTEENRFFNGVDFTQSQVADFKSGGDNLSFAQLNYQNFVGARYSKQIDGSYLFAVHVPKEWLQLTDDELSSLAHETETGVLDPKGEDIDAKMVKKFYGGVLNNMPTRFTIGMWVGYPKDKLHPDNQYELERYNADGTLDKVIGIKQPDSKVDLNGQSGIVVHLINAYDGSDVITPISSIGWPAGSGHPVEVDTVNWQQILPTGYSYSHLLDNNKLLNGQTWNGNYKLLNGTNLPATIDYPAHDTDDYAVFVTPDKETAMVCIIDTSNKTLKVLTADGYYNQAVNVDGVDKALDDYSSYYRVVSNIYHAGQDRYHLAGNAYVIKLARKAVLDVQFESPDGNLLGNYSVDGIVGGGYTIDQSYVPKGYVISAGQDNVLTGKLQADKQTLTILVTPRLKNETEHKTIARQINIYQPDGSVKSIRQEVKFTRHILVNGSTGKVEKRFNWVADGPDHFEAVMPAHIDGYTIKPVESEVVTGNSRYSTVNVSYEKLSVDIVPKYVDATGKTYNSMPISYHVAANQTGNGSQLILKDIKPIVNKTEYVTRTIKVELPNGKTRLIRQRVMKGHKFGTVRLPKLRGYKAVISGGQLDNAVADKDAVLTVKFEK